MTTTREIHPVDMQMVKEYLTANLILSVTTTSEYQGSMGFDSLYKDSHTLQLVLDGEVISEVQL